MIICCFFFFQAEDGIRDKLVTGVQTCALPICAGKVHALGTSGYRRSPVMPETPTIAEAGVPGYEATIWLGLMAPAGTPRPILEKLNVEISKVVNAPEVKEAWSKQGAVPISMSVEIGRASCRERV